ncbi:hypothetical protein LPJ60_006542, partial [Coemansia sp. RSA 2675]
PTTAIVTVTSGETTSAPLSNSVVTVAQPSGPTASIGGSSSESPASDTSDDTAHTCVAGKVAEDDGLRCEYPAGNIAIGLSGVLPASNTSDEAGAAHGTNVNNTLPKVRRNSAPAVATEAAGQSARRRASSSNGVVIAAPTVKLDELVSTALVATQAPTVAEASKGVAEPIAVGTVSRPAMPRPGRSNKGKEAEVVDAATNSSNEPSGSSSRAVVAEQAVGPIANTIDSVQPTVPISNGVRSGGEVAMQAGKPYASSDVGPGTMLIDAGLQPGEPSAADTVMQDVEQPVMDMVVEEAEPLVVDAAMHDAETSNVASTSHVVVPAVTDMVVEYVEPHVAGMGVVGAKPFVADASMQDAEMPNVASTSHVVVPPTATDVEMEAVAPASLGIEVEEG